MAQQSFSPTILPERRGWLRRRTEPGRAPVPAAAEPGTAPAAADGAVAAEVAQGVPAAEAMAEARAEAVVDDVAGLERLAARAPELAAREAAELVWQEQERRRRDEEAARVAAERERQLREESLDMAERLASLVEQRAEQRAVAAGAWDAIPAWEPS
ncbi:MAG: hypothetical protein ACJ74O_19240 [Frankiaceae bacterium]